MDRETVSFLQSTLVLLGHDHLRVDGILGPRTLSAYSALSEDDRRMVNELVASRDPNALPHLREALEVDRTNGRIRAREGSGTKSVTHDEVTRMIRAVSAELDVPESYLQLMVSLENHRTPDGYAIEYDGPFRGIAQFNRATWESIRRLYPSLNLPEFEVGVTDELQSLLAAGALYHDNKRSFERTFGTESYFTDEIAYVYHQQGASAAAEFLRSGRLVYPNQSESSKLVARRALSHHQAV